MLNNIEKKGKFGDSSQTDQRENCAIGDAVAQRMCRMAQSAGGASVPASRSPKLFSTPNQIKNPTLERPIFNPLNQSFPKRIFLNINPLLGIILAVAQPMMPAARLKFPLRVLVLQRKFSLPISNPGFNRKMQISRRTKQMQMIWHQQIITNEPSRGLRPCLTQKLMSRFVI